MTFEADLNAVLDTATGHARNFFGFAPVNTSRPYTTAQQIGGEVINPLANTNPGTRLEEVQIDVWANSYAEAVTAIRAIEVAMRAASTFTATPLSAARTDYDADVPVYRASQDFRCIT